MEFLDKDNIAGQSLLQLVARGSSIITELLRLSDHIPPVFLGSPGNPQENQKYASILLDFRYLKATEAYDEKIDRDADAVDLDEEFRETHLALLERFYTLFDSMYKYIENLNSYIEDMHKGSFLQHTIDGVLDDPHGKQLMCEAFYLYGCMLLLLDLRIPGPARERMIIAYYRYKGSALLHNIDEVCRLCRDTGFTVTGKRPANYPEEFFARVPVDMEVIDMIIGRLRSDDIYNHASAFPLPVHRSTALAQQSALLYVILYFAPDLLKNGTAVCREIVDKFFVDNWMVCMYMGFVVDITEAWDPYKAAKNALKGALTKEVQQKATAHHAQLCASLNTELDHLLTQGVLTEEYLMDNQRKLMAHTRACNVTLRWLLLHRASGNSKVREMVRAAVATPEVLRLLMNTAQFEFLFKGMCKKLLDEKQDRWLRVRTEASELIQELSDVYGGTKALSRVKKNEKLRTWFAEISTEISAVNLHNGVVAGRTLTQLVGALQGVEANHHVEASLQVVQCLGEVRQMLTDMVRLANITNKLLGDLDIIGDFSYAQKLITAYTPLLHTNIARDPSVCLLLRATFLKLSSILSAPLVRIIQAGSADDVSVAEYFSSSLVSYVRSVLEIVPKSVFEILGRISALTSKHLKPLPSKMERKDLKEAAQMNERYSLAKLTHNVSVFTRGILNMHTTLLGIVKLDPQQTLEVGIRKELVRVVSTALHEQLVFPTGKLADMEARLRAVGAQLLSMRHSLEYIQDYINAYGLKMWQEELCRVMNYNVEQERNEFIKKKVYDWQSEYQSEEIPIPAFSRAQSGDQGKFVNFTGRVLNELMRHSAPQTHTYSPHVQAWLSQNDGTITVGPNIFALLRESLTVFGLCGLDKLLSFRIVRQLSDVIKYYKSIYVAGNGNNEMMLAATHELTPASQFPQNGLKVYITATAKLEKPLTILSQLVTGVGQMVLLRVHMSRELRFSAQTESGMLASALTNMNTAVLNELSSHYNNSEKHNYPENPLMPQLAKWLDTMGMVDPISKIYFTTDPLAHPALTLFLLVVHVCGKLKWDPKLNTLVAIDKRTHIDGASFTVGLACLLQQLHSVHTHTWLTYIGQYVRATISAAHGSNTIIPPLTNTVLLFVHEYCRHTHTPRETVEAVVPAYLLDAVV